MASGDECEGHSRAERYPRCGICAAHETPHVVSDRIESGNRDIVRAKHTRLSVCLETGECGDLAWDKLDRVEGCPIKRSKVRIWLLVRITRETVKERLSSPEFRVLPTPGMFVEGADSRFECLRIQTYPLREFAEAFAYIQVSRPDMFVAWHGCGFDESHTPAIDGRLVADEKSFDFLIFRVRSEHSLHEVMVGARLIHKASPAAINRDETWFMAIDEVGIGSLVSLFSRNNRHGHPCSRLDDVGGEDASRSLTESDAVAGIANRRKNWW